MIEIASTENLEKIRLLCDLPTPNNDLAHNYVAMYVARASTGVARSQRVVGSNLIWNSDFFLGFQ